MAILSDGLWRRSFGADPNLAGQIIKLNREAYTVVAVMPPDLEHSAYGADL